jgi:predicted nucleotidyltransferase
MNIVELLKAEFENDEDVLLVILFGSFASNTYSAESDLDVAYLTRGSLSIDQILAVQNRLAAKFNREIDLVDLRKAHGALLQEILSRGLVVLKKDHNAYYLLLKRMLGESEDDSRVHAKVVEERKQNWRRQTKI